MQNKLSVITVSYNNADHITEFLDGLRKNILNNSEIRIVDSNSTDQTVYKIKKYLDHNKKFAEIVTLIESPKNAGFAKGMNLAAKDAAGEYLFLLNPDTLIESDVFSPLIKYEQEHNDIGIIAPQLIMTNGEIQKTLKKEPTIKGLIKEYYLGQKHAYSEYFLEGNEPVEVESVYGAAMLIKTDLFRKLGGFNEKYFLYYEDADLCRKVRSLGKKVIYFPTTNLKHAVGGSKDNIRTELPTGIRTLAWFVPIKGAGRNYYQVKSRNIYHGLPKSLLMATLLYIAGKKKKKKK